MSPPLLKKTSGTDCIKILCKHFGFKVVRQSGSHIILKKETPDGPVGTVVPNHRELKLGTLRSILELADVDEFEFSQFQ